MGLNHEQLTATDPARNIWLSANAGTGKTFVLAHRFLRLILDGNEVGRIVCITYTKAAAAEMKERIVRLITDLLLLDDKGFLAKVNEDYQIVFDEKSLKKMRTKLSVLLNDPDSLKINTIHSFCQTILKSFPLESGIPPFFSVIDNYQTSDIEQKAWNLLTLSRNAQIMESLDYLLARFQLNALKENLFELKKISNKIFSLVESKSGLNGYLDYLHKALSIHDANIIELEAKLHGEVHNILETLSELIKSKVFDDKFVSSNLALYLKTRNYDDLHQVFFTEKGDFRSCFNKKLAKDFPAVLEELNYHSRKVAEFDSIRKDYLCFHNTRYHLVLLQAFCAEYENLKKLKYLLEYEDLINITANLLSNKNPNSSWVLYKLDGGIDHILLDESQDTSPSQWKVIEAITEEYFAGTGTKDRKRSLFIVGDEKQSIYSFQGADINVFNQKKDFYKNIKKLSEENKFEFISINTSYRSSEAVLKIVDEVLKNEKVKASVSKTDIIDLHNLNRKNSFGYFELNQLCGEKPKQVKNERMEWFLPSEYSLDESVKNKDILAKKAADRVVEILNRTYPLAETGAAPKAGDIMILLRKRDAFADRLIAEIQKAGVKISGIDRLYLNENIVIKDILSLAKFVNLPSDDLNLACLLKSPIFEISEDELFKLCWNRGGLSLLDNIRINSKELSQKLNSITKIAANGLYRFFYELIEVAGNREKFIAYYGTQINEIIDEFLSLAEDFENNNSKNISDFIDWFEKNPIEIKRNLNNKSAELRIITAHGSKGLEAPIVIIPDATSKPIGWENYGFAGDIFLCPMRSEYKNDLFKQIESNKKAEDNAEYLRLLYVALTRARDELYVFGTHEYRASPDNWHNLLLAAVEPLCEKLEDKFVYSSPNYMNAKITAAPEAVENKNIIELKKFAKFEDVGIISPSKLIYLETKTKLGQSNQEMIKGVLIHKLLELSKHFVSGDGEAVFDNIFAQYPEIGSEDLKNIKAEVLRNINNSELAFLFSGNSRNEVPIFGYDGEKLISGKIDKIVVDGDRLTIVDYKTTKIQAEDDLVQLSQKFAPQLQSYKNLVQKIYPDKEIRTAILFTNISKLEWLD